jgi:hypothetical protein
MPEADETGAAAVADAYVWGYPLVTMHRLRAGHPAAGSRGLVRRDRLSTAADRAVVGPNNDTLYASGWFDLRAGDLTVDAGVLDPPGRYWSVMLLDAYTNVAYVCRRLHGSGGARVRVTLDPARPAPDARADVVPLATPTVWVLARVLVDGPRDLDAARAALRRLAVTQDPDGPGAVPPRPPLAGRDAARADPGAAFLADLRGALAVDPPAPWQPPPPAGLAALLVDPPPADVVAAGIEAGEARIRDGRGVDLTRHGWGTRSRGAAFGDDVAYRAAFARFSLAGHLPTENRGYSRIVDGAAAAVLRFPAGGGPPVGAFWSLTVYGPDLFLVPNEIDRYSVGDRTPGLKRDADGSLPIVLRPDRPTDPAATANWLPTPPGPCVLVLRAYEGRPEVVAADWFPPDLETAP